METQLLADVHVLLGEKNYAKIKSLLLHHDAAEIADVLNALDSNKRKLFSSLPPEVQADVIIYLSDDTKRFLLPKLFSYDIARFIHFMAEDDATDILQYLPQNKLIATLHKLKPEKRSKIEVLVKFGKETAGGLMDLNYVVVQNTDSIKDIITSVQNHIKKERKVPFVVVCNEKNEVEGYISHRNLISPAPSATTKQLASPLPLVPHGVDQEKIIEYLHEEKTGAIGVVDDNNNLLGIIHISDLLRVAQAEATEDVYSFAGITKEQDINDSVRTKVRLRYKWLIINLGTAFLASGVVSLFSDTISEIALLAVFMPIVAGMGGNTATQSLAVVVRGLALGDVPWAQAKRIIIKEASSGAVNGIIVGTIAMGVALLFRAPPMLGVILGMAMVFNMFIAGFFGALVPFVLKSFKIDPAIASSIFVTTATDIIGFLVFLGLGSIFLT